MNEDFQVEDDFTFTHEDEEVLREIRSGVDEIAPQDPVNGRTKKHGAKSVLNKRKLSKHEMDELFLDY